MPSVLSTEQIRDHLARLSYRPGWSFQLREHPFEGHQVFIIGKDLPDSYSTSNLDIGVLSFLPPMPDTTYLEQWIAWRLARIETHEMREFLKRDGQPIFDPHGP